MHLASLLQLHTARAGLLALVWLATSVPAHAIPLTYSQYFNINFNSTVHDEQFPNVTHDTVQLGPQFTLPRFDASLGTLRSVDMSFNSFYVHAVTAYATDSLAENTNFITCNTIPLFPCYYENDALVSTIVDSSMTLTLLDPYLDATLDVGRQQVSCSVDTDEDRAVQCNERSSLFGFFNGALDASSVPLEFFIGADPLGFDLEANYSLFGNCDDDDRRDTCLVHLDMPWAGTLFLTYDYDETVVGGGGEGPPTSVPEPDSLALLGLGLLGLLRRVRHRPRVESA